MNLKKGIVERFFRVSSKNQTLVTDKSILSCMTAERVMFIYLQERGIQNLSSSSLNGITTNWANFDFGLRIKQKLPDTSIKHMSPWIFVGSVIEIRLYHTFIFFFFKVGIPCGCTLQMALFSWFASLFKNLFEKLPVYDLSCFVNGTNELLFTVSVSRCN